jgi:hypothetical protein
MVRLSEYVVPGEAERSPPKFLCSVLLVSIALERDCVRVIRPPIELDQQLIRRIRKVSSTDDPPTGLEDLELWQWQLDLAVEEDTKKAILEITLGLSTNAPVHVEKWPNNSDTATSPPCNPSHKTIDFGHGEQLQSQRCAESALDQPGACRAKIHNCP